MLTRGDLQLYVDGREKTTFFYDPATHNLTYSSGRLSYGKHTVKVVARDAVNAATETRSFKVVRRSR